MALRLQLHNVLKGMVEHVYFQPPSNVQLEYPCIVYMRDGSRTDHADNAPYRRAKRYQVTVIDRDPDSELPDQVEGLSTCIFDRFYPSDNLNHWVLHLFF